MLGSLERVFKFVFTDFSPKPVKQNWTLKVPEVAAKSLPLCNLLLKGTFMTPSSVGVDSWAGY